MGINLVPTEISNFYNPILAEIFFSIIGLVFIATGVKAFRDTATAKHVTTGIFWTIMGVCFIIGKYIPSWIVGVLIVASAVITAIGGVVQTKNDIPTKEETRANADHRLQNFYFGVDVGAGVCYRSYAGTGIRQ